MGMTLEQLRQMYGQGSKSFQQRNPDLVGVGEVETQKSKSTPSQTLVGGASKHEGGKKGVAIIVSFTAFTKRELDDDNLIGSIKPLRDVVASFLHIDDADPRIKFEYGQQKTDGEQGVAVKIQRLSTK